MVHDSHLLADLRIPRVLWVHLKLNLVHPDKSTLSVVHRLWLLEED